MKYFIAIDSGGYKTESILFDQTGKVYAYARGRGANAFDIGVAEASDRIRDAAENMKARMPADGEIASVFGSISASYYFPEIEQRLKRQFGKAKVKMDSVVSSVMAAGLGKDDGVCLISGTGSMPVSEIYLFLRIHLMYKTKENSASETIIIPHHPHPGRHHNHLHHIKTVLRTERSAGTIPDDSV